MTLPRPLTHIQLPTDCSLIGTLVHFWGNNTSICFKITSTCLGFFFFEMWMSSWHFGKTPLHEPYFTDVLKLFLPKSVQWEGTQKCVLWLANVSSSDFSKGGKRDGGAGDRPGSRLQQISLSNDCVVGTRLRTLNFCSKHEDAAVLTMMSEKLGGYWLTWVHTVRK